MRLSFLLVSGIVAATMLARGSGVSAQRPARTPDGRPDLQGLWLNDTATPLERTKEYANQAFFTPEEAREYEKHYQLDRTAISNRDEVANVLKVAGDLDTYEPGRVLPDLRTSLITDPPDGRVPALTAEAQQLSNERAEHVRLHYAENPEDFPNAERCLVVGNAAVPPLLPVFYNNTVQIVQTPAYVTIVSEMIHDARVIPLDGRGHLPPSIRQWMGDSVGRWEGDTLVVDTTNFSDNISLRGSGPKLHVIERFTLRDLDTLVYQFTIDDPGSFVRSWSGTSQMSRTAGPMYEYACHEANYSMTNVLRAARAADRGASGAR